MLEVFAASGFTVQRALDTGVFHVAFPTADTPQVRAASTERERVAAAQSMRAFLNPRSVAVVGVSRRGGDGVAASMPPPRRPQTANSTAPHQILQHPGYCILCLMVLFPYKRCPA
jgi:hypothetical protein